MNKNTILFLLFIIIIILAIYYLYTINNKENIFIENFSQPNSLSTMFQQTVDSNEVDYVYRGNQYNMQPTTSNNESEWNGNYNDNVDPPSIYASFLEINDQIIFSLSKEDFELDEEIEDNSTNCLNNTFVGIGQLNINKNSFVLKNIICNNYSDLTSIQLEVNNLIGIIDKSGNNVTITLKDNSGKYINLYKIMKKNANGQEIPDNLFYSPMSNYLKLASYVKPIPVFTDSYNSNMDVCYNSTFGSTYNEKGQLTKCFINNTSLPLPGQDEASSYGTGCSASTTAGTYTDSSSGEEQNYNICSNNSIIIKMTLGSGSNAGTKNNIIVQWLNEEETKLSQDNITTTESIPNQNISKTFSPNNIEQIKYARITSSSTDGFNIKNISINNVSSDNTGWIDTNSTTGAPAYRDYPVKPPTTCYISNDGLSSVSNYPECQTYFDINRTFNSPLTQGLYTENMCSFLGQFKSLFFNSALILYVNDLQNVESLNYEYFGQGNGKSNLIMQNDISSSLMEPLLKKYREFITNGSSTNTQLNNALSLTNCIENKNSIVSYSDLLTSCKNIVKNELNNSNNSEQIESESSTLPLVWNIDKIDYANQTPCTFSISSSKLYTKESQWQKFAEFDPNNNKTNMSLYKGGTNQIITLENATVLSKDDLGSTNASDVNSNYILLSGNLRTSNPKKYLVPSYVKSGFYNDSSIINLENKPYNNGKWVILGFNLTNITNLQATLNTIETKLKCNLN